MAKSKLTESQKKKLELESELKEIQKGIDESINEVKSVATESLGPRTIIKKYPLPVVGAAFLLGFIVGKPRSKPKTHYSTRSSSNREGFGDLLLQEIKRLAVKRGVAMLNDKIDETLHSTSNQSDHE